MNNPPALVQLPHLCSNNGDQAGNLGLHLKHDHESFIESAVMDETNTSPISVNVENELQKCSGRMDAFTEELKLLYAQLDVVTNWINHKFRVQIIKKDLVEFKHIFDYEEIKQLSTALSSHVGPVEMVKRRRGGSRPSKNSGQGEDNYVPQKKKRRSQKKSNETLALEPVDPQDFVETVFDDTRNYYNHQYRSNKVSEQASRPQRASRKTINYQEEYASGGHCDDALRDSNNTHGSNPSEENGRNNSELKLANPPRDNNKGKVKNCNSGDEPELLDTQKISGDTTEVDSISVTTKNRSRTPKKPGTVWNSAQPKQCEECGKVLKGSSTLKLHKMMHADERPHPCEICGNKFRFRRNLRIHVMAIHTGERPLQCSYCGRKFYAPKDLRIHERTHTGEKPHPCPTCPKRFNVKEHLKMHIRVHTGEKPYKCSTCDKEFSQANSLRIHRKIHLRDKEVNSNDKKGSSKCHQKLKQGIDDDGKRSEINSEKGVLISTSIALPETKASSLLVIRPHYEQTSALPNSLEKKDQDICPRGADPGNIMKSLPNKTDTIFASQQPYFHQGHVPVAIPLTTSSPNLSDNSFVNNVNSTSWRMQLNNSTGGINPHARFVSCTTATVSAMSNENFGGIPSFNGSSNVIISHQHMSGNNNSLHLPDSRFPHTNNYYPPHN